MKKSNKKSSNKQLSVCCRVQSSNASPESSSDECGWGSRRMYMTAILSQVVGISTSIFMPHRAVNHGAVGHLVTYILIYIILGVPLFYMEYVVGQFTARDCLSVWRARGFLSHLGCVYILWQFTFLIYCHTVNSAVLHYFLISFENPIPYYACGYWSTKNCNILSINYTVNQDCIRSREPYAYCRDLYYTYPEYQYWRYFILGTNRSHFHVAWRVGLASVLICIVVYLACFKRLKSLKWVLSFVTVYPFFVNVIMLIGSMLQKGIVVKFEEALDTDFSKFITHFNFSATVVEVLYALNVGTGLSFNIASRTSFRSPCYSNSVVMAVISCAATILGIFIIAMMTCPYAYEFGVKPGAVLIDEISYTFEKAPRLLHSYHSTGFWLVLTFSTISASALSMNIIIISCLLEMISIRKPTAARYPGFVAFAAMITLYLLTIPMLSNASFNFIMDFKQEFNMITILMVILENIVFVLWYGLERFSEDIHFMQGVQPRAWVKVGWVASSVVLCYVFCNETYVSYLNSGSSLGSLAGWWMVIASIVWIFLVSVVRLLVGACRKRCAELVRLDPTWGPRSEVLQRSRAMFTAQAMTKEYMYRQYHLQAGIISRQKRSNVRNPDLSRHFSRNF